MVNVNKTIGSSTTIAKSDDGSIQINFTIPFEIIKKEREDAANELSKNIEIPGFRKGKAPLDKVISALPTNTLLEKTLSKILPKLISEAIEKNNLKPAIYPKFELIKAKEEEDWQIMASTCELPEVNLGNYKETISGSLRVKKLWTPKKDIKEEKKFTREEKEQEALKTLLETVKLNIPKILLEEETDTRISRLLERIEKLGLSLESYLSSINKTTQDLRYEYEKQAKEAISIELILTKIADEEKIQVDAKELEEMFKVSSADQKLAREINTPEKRKLVEAVLRRRKALQFLTSLS